VRFGAADAGPPIAVPAAPAPAAPAPSSGGHLAATGLSTLLPIAGLALLLGALLVLRRRRTD
jgi:LPXTG-motif cell wall-anchored protein